MILDDKMPPPFGDDVGLEGGSWRTVIIKTCYASVDLKRRCVEESAVEEGFETGLVEWMGSPGDFGHGVGVCEADLVETEDSSSYYQEWSRSRIR